jgi:hypothetical protein
VKLNDVLELGLKDISQNLAAARLCNRPRRQFIGGCVHLIHSYARKALLEYAENLGCGDLRQGTVEIDRAAFLQSSLVQFLHGLTVHWRNSPEQSTPENRPDHHPCPETLCRIHGCSF